MEKKYILTDFTQYGNTLRNAEELLRDIFGVVPNLKALPIKNILGEVYESRGIPNLFSMSRFKDYSPVGKLPAKEIENVYKQASEDTAEEYKGSFTQKVRKLFRILTMDSYIEGNFDEVPWKEINTIIERSYSLEAIRRKINRSNKILSSYV